MLKVLRKNWLYLVWFLFYFAYFMGITLGYAIIFYIISVLIALTPLSEKLWRGLNGVRPLRLRMEKERLFPIFKEVYEGAITANPKLSKKIRLYIKEDMNVNAFAFGRKTLVITRGAFELLNDECLKGLISHELGHFSHYDTHILLFATVCNLPFTLIIRAVESTKSGLDKGKGVFISVFKAVFDIIYYLFKGFQYIGDLILMYHSRKNEYYADEFAIKCGFGKDLTAVLIQIYKTTISKPQSVKEYLKSTHPNITRRIEELEDRIY